MPGVRLASVATPEALVAVPTPPPTTPVELRLIFTPWTGPDPLVTVTRTDPVPAERVGRRGG